MSSGALAGSLGLALIAVADRSPIYFACWLLIGTGMSATLYDPAFATLARIFGASARRQITLVTFAGGYRAVLEIGICGALLALGCFLAIRPGAADPASAARH